MKAGTVIRLPDGRIGTVVYNGLDGVGIKWGEHRATLADLRGSGCTLIGVQDEIPEDYEWTPDAMLRAPYRGAELECVGKSYAVLDEETPK